MNMPTEKEKNGLSEAQYEIVRSRGCNILVSAAAGSGKTRVLTERIVSRLTDESDPVDIDRILVLTFTKAAAAEMRERISSAINEAAKKKDASEHIKKQAILIHNAQITTIDSFCLNIIKNNFTEIGLEPGFRVANENEVKVLADEVLDEVLEEVLANKDDSNFGAFLDRFESKDSLRKIKKIIEEMYKQASKVPFTEDYIEQRRKDYSFENAEELKDSVWFKEMEESIRSTIADAIKRVALFKEHCEQNGPEEYIPVADSDMGLLISLTEAKRYEELENALVMGMNWMTLPRKTTCDPEWKEQVKDERNLYKDLINGIKAKYFPVRSEVWIDRMRQTGKVTDGLLNVVSLYIEKLDEAKRKKGILTFSDIEHMALKILLKKEDGRYVPSDVALDYRNYYKELMIDEYQDSNYIQEWLLHSISGEDDGIYDRFMVGDVKQSIYRFRNADPSLFMEKYDCYSKDGGPLSRHVLSVNYRSRREVLGPVNAVFEKYMDKRIGGVDYDADNRLNYSGAYDDADKIAFNEGMDEEAVRRMYEAELILLNRDADSKLSKEEQEAKLICMRIKQLLKEHRVYDRENKCLRPCKFSDIAILMRSIPADMNDIRRIYDEAGIPVHTNAKGGYFDTSEVVTILNFLSILDNPRNDIPMFGSLMSLFGGFDEKETALLKLFGGEYLYDDLNSAASGEALQKELSVEAEALLTAIRAKSADFLKKYRRYKEMVPYTPVYKILRLIMSESDYIGYISAFPGGEQKKANVLALISKAESFEKDGFRGIFDFCKYIEKLHKYESDEGEVNILNDDADVVRIMTMHKSKGLEFPVCILAGLSKRFNMSDSRDEVIFHDNLGMALDYIDTAKRIKCKDVRKAYIASRIKEDSISEELRVLYVAMTRAQEKLIMTAVTDDIEKTLETACDEKPDLITRLSSSSFLDILINSRGKNDWNGQCILESKMPEDIGVEAKHDYIDKEKKRMQLDESMTKLSDSEMRAVDKIRIKLLDNYPHPELRDLYTKTSVSELKMAAISDAMIKGEVSQLPDEFFKVHDEDDYIPDFISNEEKKASGTAIGSAFHRVMELFDPALCVDGKDISISDLDAQMDKYIESGAFTKEEYDLVNKEKVIGFFNSDTGKRIQKAAKAGLLYKEKPFVLGISANRLKQGFPEEEMVLIQGIIDVFFEEDGHIVLLDYKTDSVKSEKELTDRYKTQLDYYEEALARITDKPVSERLLYSFALQKTVRS